MSDDDDLVPLKQVLEEVGVSRTTLWRALRSGIDGFPKPTAKSGRVFWKRSQIAALDAGLGAYKGRGQFDTRRQQQQAHRDLRRQMKAQAPRKRRPPAEKPAPPGHDGQGELFTSTD